MCGGAAAEGLPRNCRWQFLLYVWRCSRRGPNTISMTRNAMNRTTLKNYAPQARRDCIAAVTDRAASYGLRHDRIEPMTEQGEVVLITGISVPRNIATKRKRLEDRITRHGFE